MWTLPSRKSPEFWTQTGPGKDSGKDSLLDNEVEVDLGMLEGVEAGRLKVYCLLR